MSETKKEWYGPDWSMDDAIRRLQKIDAMASEVIGGIRGQVFCLQMAYEEADRLTTMLRQQIDECPYLEWVDPPAITDGKIPEWKQEEEEKS
jgi:hypothetical protein